MRGRLRRVAPLLPLVALLAAAVVVGVDRGGFFPSDTVELLDGVAAVDECLETGTRPCEKADKWPLLQYLPALAAKRLGASRGTTGEALVAINALAVLLLVGLAWLALAGRGRRLAVLAVLGLVAGPLWWYAGAGFAEPVAALFTCALVVAMTRGWSPALVAVCVFAAGISKETALPFLLALALIASRIPDAARAGRPARVAALLGGGLAALAANTGLNLFRYGQVHNAEYARSEWIVSGVGRRVEFFLAELVAPNAGLLWFWPVVSAVVLAVAVPAVRSRRAAVRSTLGIALVAAAIVATAASWWSPFGWHAYGARLLVPWVPAIFLLLLLAWAPEIDSVLRRLTGRRAAVVCVAVVAAAAPQLGIFLDNARPYDLFADATASCVALPADVYQRVRAGDDATQEVHNACTSERAWQVRPVLLDGYSALWGARLGWLALLALAVAGLFAAARRDPGTG